MDYQNRGLPSENNTGTPPGTYITEPSPVRREKEPIDHDHPHFSAGYAKDGVSGCGSFIEKDRRLDLLLAALLTQQQQQLAKPPKKLANAAPIGLLGFGMTTILLNLHNTGHYPLYSAIPSMGICFGGIAQLIAGLLEWSHGKTFGFVAFVSYGAFWLSLVCVWMLPNASIGGPPEVQATSEYFTGVYLLLWGIYTAMMFMCTLRMNVVLISIFGTLVILFFLLGIGKMAHSPNTIKVAGYEGVLCGALAMYLAFADVVNEVWERPVLPIGPTAEFADRIFLRKKINNRTSMDDKHERV